MENRARLRYISLSKRDYTDRKAAEVETETNKETASRGSAGSPLVLGMLRLVSRCVSQDLSRLN